MNNSKNRILVFIVVVMILTNIATLAYFLWFKPNAGREDKGERHTGPMTEFLKKDIGFDEQQMKTFDSVKQQQREAMKPLFEDLGKTKDSFYQLLSKPSVPDSQLNTLAAAIGLKQQGIEIQFFKNFKNVRELCTDAQKIKYDSLLPSIVHKLTTPQRRRGTH
jgi:protein CpxP